MISKKTRLKCRGTASIELVFLLLFVLIPTLIVGFEFARSIHARTTMTNALHMAMLAGLKEFSALSDSWSKVSGGISIKSQVNNAFDGIFKATNKYKMTHEIVYLCQCNPPEPNVPSSLDTCINPKFDFSTCQNDYIKIYLSSSAQLEFSPLMHWPGTPSSFIIGPIKAVIQIK